MILIGLNLVSDKPKEPDLNPLAGPINLSPVALTAISLENSPGAQLFPALTLK